MRCLSCNKRLNDRESVRKYSNGGGFIDLCDHCFSTVSDDIPDIEEGDNPTESIEDDSEGGDYQQFIGEQCDDC